MIRFTSDRITIKAEAGEEGERRIDAIAVPYNTFATVSDGQEVMFAPGSLPVDGKAPRVFMYHDATKPVGIVSERIDTEEGMLASMKISRTALGDEALILAADGVMDVSVGVNVIRAKADPQGRLVIEAAEWLELSLVPIPAFSGATVLDVAAEAATPDATESTDYVEETPVEATPEIAQPIEAQAVTPVPLAPIYATARKEVPLPTAAEYLAAAIAGGDQWREMSAAVRAAAPNIDTGDTPGILPTPIVGPVYNNFRGIRPVVDAIGVRAMPGGGKVFIRPEVTTHVSQGIQTNELDTLTAGTMVVFNNQVTKNTYGGYVTISEQDLDWTDPAVLSLVLDDMARIYANTTDNVAADNLVSGASSTTSFTVADIDQPGEWARWIYTASEAILGASNGNLPTHLFLSPNMWRALGLLVDDAKRPLFPQVGPMNAFGQMFPGQSEAVAFGLRVVVDRNFANDTVIVGDPTGYEIFEQQKGAISIDVPSSLGRTIAWRGYFATLMIDSTKFRKAAFV
jgi:HK97 family phage prohead protease